MLEGVHLNLMMGPVVPVPAPRFAVEALVSAVVTAEARRPSVFELTFQLGARSPLQTALLLSGGSIPPVLRVVLALSFGARTEVLIDGVVTDQQISSASGGGPSRLTVTGSDLTTVMDLIDLDGIPYPALPPEGRLLLVLAKYAALGVVPLIIPRIFTDFPNPLEEIPTHQGTDLGYIRKLADEAGYLFCIEPGPAAGSSVAYWGPEVKAGAPQPALNVDMDAHTNVENLSFRFNNESRTQYYMFVHEKTTKLPIPIPLPDLSLLAPPLGAIPPVPKRVKKLETAHLNPIRAALMGLSGQARSAASVTATGSLDVLRYGHVLKPRRLVGVRGAGEAFNGLYYVEKVTHNLGRGSYTQDFELSRDGLVSTVPKVPA